MSAGGLLLPPLHLCPERRRPRRQRHGRPGRGFRRRRFHRRTGGEIGERSGELQGAFQAGAVAGPFGGDDDFLVGAALSASAFSSLSYRVIFCHEDDVIRSLKLSASQRRAEPAAQSLHQNAKLHSA